MQSPPADQQTNQPRNRQFDLMRLVLAILVLLSHAPEMIDGNRSRELLSRFTHGALSFGSFGVDGFFLLSGFLIVKSWQRDPSLRDYLQKRILRIVPGYAVAVALSILVVGLLAPAAPHFFHMPGFKPILSVLLLGSPITGAVFPGESYPIVNGALWTIPYEFHCYLLIPLLGLVGFLRRRWLVLATASLLLLISNAFFLKVALSWHANQLVLGDASETYRLTGFFLVGCCFFLFRERIAYRPALLAAAVAGLALVHFVSVRHTEASLLVFGSYVLFYLGHHRFQFLQRIPALPDISYGVYLYGWPVEHLWLFYFHSSPWTMFFASTVICLALGWLSWHLVERPALRFKRHPTAALPPDGIITGGQTPSSYKPRAA